MLSKLVFHTFEAHFQSLHIASQLFETHSHITKMPTCLLEIDFRPLDANFQSLEINFQLLDANFQVHEICFQPLDANF